ncbi:MAG: hypothetical protein QMD00_02870 [Hadesarchaea archaeon]|nr:hypothetical protein [Hadesarchaea archaeon]
MSRKGDIREMASHVGNSAAHVAIYREGAEKEVRTYMTLASEIAERRTWNEREIEDLKEMAVRRASSVIKERIKRGDLDEKEFEETLSMAREYIDEFVKEDLLGAGK